MKNHKFIFVVGLHKSGTTILANLLKKHPRISGFNDTNFPEDEGQFLQSVFPIAKTYGGPGLFGFRKETHLTEESSILTKKNRNKLFSEWSSYWDLKKPCLLEKSPPNLLKTRFLQDIFPNSYFIVITRHPIAVSYATQKWSKTNIDSLLEHWNTCYKIFEEDRKKLENVLLIKYEDFVSDSNESLKIITNFLNIEDFNKTDNFDNQVNNKYFEYWNNYFSKLSIIKRLMIKIQFRRIEKNINKYGYSLFNRMYI